MGFGLDDVFSMNTLTGAGGGALTGALASGGNPFAIGAGALAGGAMGAYGHSKADEAHDAQKASVDAAMKRLQALQQQSYAQRMKDLDRALAFYAPVNDYMRQMSSDPFAAPGAAAKPAAPAPVPPARTGVGRF